MVEQTLIRNAEEIKLNFQLAIKKHHLTQRQMVKFCDTNEFKFSRGSSE